MRFFAHNSLHGFDLFADAGADAGRLAVAIKKTTGGINEMPRSKGRVLPSPILFLIGKMLGYQFESLLKNSDCASQVGKGIQKEESCR